MQKKIFGIKFKIEMNVKEDKSRINPLKKD